MSTTNLDTALRYLQALESGATGEALAAFFHPQVEQREYPNALTRTGQTRGLTALLAGAEKGRKLLSSQRYAVRNTLAQGDTVALEVDWSGTLAVPLRTLAAGDTLRATCGMFLTFQDGRIISQRNYDCFEPF
ncbi:nuclear transport factor 2 family protein [Pyxidicoccus fallax]|uniref:Nuclear transport factor 2 family protein n=1 Tax=Pyxidicoccus fallax TaxID=394095 RepID=A0A848LAW3_9BACT|nr:nuclear transport factor 2 family protein [Pyxidicoccus fallax]NMO13823.1 nuclear transport factor 2 family protein [Pyxidicoccus fallax]NPC86093.1 nuclear transport factor 2 family protein [Pyxidicoccus fallax]